MNVLKHPTLQSLNNGMYKNSNKTRIYETYFAI